MPPLTPPPLSILDMVESLLATDDICRDWYVPAKRIKKSRAHRKAQHSFRKPKHSQVVYLIGHHSNGWFCAQHQWFDRFCSPLESPQRAKSGVINLRWSLICCGRLTFAIFFSISSRRPTRHFQNWARLRPGMSWGAERRRMVAVATATTKMDVKLQETVKARTVSACKYMPYSSGDTPSIMLSAPLLVMIYCRCCNANELQQQTHSFLLMRLCSRPVIVFLNIEAVVVRWCPAVNFSGWLVSTFNQTKYTYFSHFRNEPHCIPLSPISHLYQCRSICSVKCLHESLKGFQGFCFL